MSVEDEIRTANYRMTVEDEAHQAEYADEWLKEMLLVLARGLDRLWPAPMKTDE
jgi:hypothetical protein